MRIRHAALSIVTGVSCAVGSMAVVTPSAQASSTRCSVFSYVGHHGVSSYHATPVVTHLSIVALPPQGSRTTTRTAGLENVLTATTSKSGGGEGGASWLWASVKGHFDKTVAKSGQHTSTHSTTVTDVTSNPTSHNAAFVVFRGNEKYYGNRYLTYCHATGGSSIGDVAKHYWGWKTYGTYTVDGIVRCGAGSGGIAIFREALKYCT